MKFGCADCHATFSKPSVKQNEAEDDNICAMLTDIPPATTRRADVFLASSVMLKVQRDMISAVTADSNGNDFGTYINLFHCEDDDPISQRESQQDIYNRKIKECDIFVIIIDNSEIGEITLSEVILAAEQKRSRGIKMAAFVHEGKGSNGGKARW